MYPLLETICIDAGTFRNMPGHAARIERSCQKLFGVRPAFDVHEILSKTNVPPVGMHKCRLRYNAQTAVVEIEPYTLKPIRSLRCVEAPHLTYDLKYANRDALNAVFAERNGCDDVLITQAGWVRDTSYGNICFLKDGVWYTPEQPLLCGTMREWMLAAQRVTPRPLHVRDLHMYSHFVVINAFRHVLWPEGMMQSLQQS